jgi:hypothetical protein
MNFLSEKEKNDNRKYKLVYDYEEQHNYLKETYTYLPNLMNFLWKDPKIVAKLLANSDIDDVKNNLAPFVVNNFYENILSSVYIEDNLMYIISLLLMDEIKSIEKINDNKFLENTAGGYVLEQLKNKIDVQNYFKTIMLSLVEKLEEISSSQKIILSIKQIEEDLQERIKMDKNLLNEKDIEKKYFKKSISSKLLIEDLDDEEEMLNDQVKMEKEKNLFSEKYIPDLTKDELINMLSKFEGNKGMKEYLNIQINNCKKDPTIFHNSTLLDNVYKSKVSNNVLAFYQIDFCKVIKLLNELFHNLIKNIYLIPYSVKCICKIILLLIKKKFPNINTIEQNVIISKFFFCKLFLPIFKSPGIGALINNFIISGTTIHNLERIACVIEKFISGNLVKNEEDNGDFSPFNRFFLDKMPEALKFFDNITKVKLPPFIEKLINGNLPNNFAFDYFNENPDEFLFHQSICFSLEDLNALLNNMEKCKDILFKNENTIYLQKTFEKMQMDSNKEIINELLKNDEYEIIKMEKKKKEKQGKKILNFFLFTDLLENPKKKNLFSMSQERPYFTLKELKNIQNESERKKNNIIKIKNLFCGLLYNYRTLVRTDFDEGTTVNTIKILKELKKFMKTSNFVIDGSIPSEWYVDSLISKLPILSSDLQANDFEALYKSMENDINNSIKQIDFETMSVYFGKVKFAMRGKIYYENVKNTLIDIELNEKVTNIVEKTIIPSIIYFSYTDKEKELKIEKGKNIKEIPLFDINKDDTEKKKFCSTIESFTNKFPDIKEILEHQDVKLFPTEEELKLNDQISHYFKIIKEHLIKHLKMDETQKEFQDINNKIYDYVMEKIYDKICPIEMTEDDILIFKRCIELSWTEPKHFIKEKNNYFFESFLPDVIGYFQKIELEKSPRKKLENMNNIFISIGNLVKFNGENNGIGVDDQLPILNYAFIKAKSQKIYSDCKFMKLFIGDKKNKEEGNELAQLEGVCLFIQNISSKDLYDVSDEVFEKNRQLAYN